MPDLPLLSSCVACALATVVAFARQDTELPPPVAVDGAHADAPEDMAAYTEAIPDLDATFRMLPIPAGRFVMGSPDDETERGDDESPQREIAVGAFWMAEHEVTWGLYNEFLHKLDIQRRTEETAPLEQDGFADAVSRPTPPYVPIGDGPDTSDHPAACMTQLAARQFTKWLSMKTGRFYRLATEAEWEYACRAGTTTRWSFGDDETLLDEHAWHDGNSDGRARTVGQLKPNPWGLYDMHGNVCEWVLDAYEAEGYAAPTGDEAEAGTDGDADAAGPLADPVHWPTALYQRATRGGSWNDDPAGLRSAARTGSHAGWQRQDPQMPKSIWHHTDAHFVGLRVVRPFAEATEEERQRAWEPDVERIRKIMKRQRRGER